MQSVDNRAIMKGGGGVVTAPLWTRLWEVFAVHSYGLPIMPVEVTVSIALTLAAILALWKGKKKEAQIAPPNPDPEKPTGFIHQ